MKFAELTSGSAGDKCYVSLDGACIIEPSAIGAPGTKTQVQTMAGMVYVQETPSETASKLTSND